MPSPPAATASMIRRARVTDDAGATPASVGYNSALRTPHEPRSDGSRDDRAPTRRRPAPQDRRAGRRGAQARAGAHRHPAVRRRAAAAARRRGPARPPVGPAAPARGPAQRRARPGHRPGARPQRGRGLHPVAPPATTPPRVRDGAGSASICGVQVTPVTRDRLVDEVVALVRDRAGRVRLAVDGAPPTDPVGLARRVAGALRVLGREALVVDAGDFLRPASVRLEFGREDPDELLTGWLDAAGLRREVLDPAGPGGSGRVLPRLWDAAADRAYRDRYTELPDDGVVLLAGSLLLGRGLPLDAAVHLLVGPAALTRGLPPELIWTRDAYSRYARDNGPEERADLVVLADHPDRPAIRRRSTAPGRR